MQVIKVLYIHHVVEMHGSTISFFNMLNGLKKEEIEPVVVIPNNIPCDDFFKKTIEKLGIKTYAVPLVWSVVDRKDYNTWSYKHKLNVIRYLYVQKYRSYKRLSKIVRTERPHIIHTTVGMIHEGFVVAKRYSIPHVFHVREYQEKGCGWKIIPSRGFFCWMLKKSFVITITNDLKENYGIEKYGNAFTIYNGIYSRQSLSMVFPKENFFFCANRISRDKGLPDVILAFAVFCKAYPRYKLFVAGSGDNLLLEELKKLTLINNCSNNVLFLGQMDIDNVYNYMQRARALVVGSYYEGFGRMTAEAAFAGCIVIGRNTGGTKEIIDMIGGYRYENLEELTTSMNIVADLPEMTYKEKALYAQSQATRWFSTEQNIEKTMKLYQSILKSH